MLLKEAEEFAEKEYAKNDELHQWDHVEDVLEIVLKLSESYPEVDMEILKLAIFFHDISYESFELHPSDSAKVGRNFLSGKISEDKLNKISDIILNHHQRDSKTLEGKIMYDADRIVYAIRKKKLNDLYDKFYLDEARKLADDLM